jgi:hypothetical protein
MGHGGLVAGSFDLITNNRAGQRTCRGANQRPASALPVDLVADNRARAGAQRAAHKSALLYRGGLTTYDRRRQYDA